MRWSNGVFPLFILLIQCDYFDLILELFTTTMIGWTAAFIVVRVSILASVQIFSARNRLFELFLVL